MHRVMVFLVAVLLFSSPAHAQDDSDVKKELDAQSKKLA